jgi:hypothetical protein
MDLYQEILKRTEKPISQDARRKMSLLAARVVRLEIALERIASWKPESNDAECLIDMAKRALEE